MPTPGAAPGVSYQLRGFVDCTKKRLIISDIAQNERKYILVSTNGFSDDVVPMSFKGREVVGLSDPITRLELDQIKGKIFNMVLQPFVDVAPERKLPIPAPLPSPVVNDETASTPVVINELRADSLGASSYEGKFSRIEYLLSVSIQNQSTVTLTDIVLEIKLPREFDSVRRDTNTVLRQDNDYYYLSYPFVRIYSDQTQFSSTIAVTINHNNAKTLYDKAIKATVYGERIRARKEFPIKDIFYFAGDGRKRFLTPDDFESEF